MKLSYYYSMKNKIIFCVLLCSMMISFVACKPASLTSKYEGIWVPVDGGWDSFIITSDSIMGVYSNKTRCLQCAYRIVKDNTIEIKRSWIANPERIDYIDTVSIYFNEENHLIIENYIPSLAQTYPPEYNDLKLKKK